MTRSWKICNRSNGEVNRAGRILAEHSDPSANVYRAAYAIMDEFRRSHAFPLNTIQMTLRRRAKELDPKSSQGQRLKRAPSIIAKLHREPNMQLSRMQDLGGARAVLESVDKVYELLKVYEKSRDRHKRAGFKDYIKHPNNTGYRGLHIIFKYQSDRSNLFNNRRIEVQIRTKSQHAWSTAVETAGFMLKEQLKSGIGPVDWLDLFKSASAILA